MYSIYSCFVLQAPLAATQAIHISNIFDLVSQLSCQLFLHHASVAFARGGGFFNWKSHSILLPNKGWFGGINSCLEVAEIRWAVLRDFIKVSSM